jgi:cytoskeletal protein CcmA (bactofilin family)
MVGKVSLLLVVSFGILLMILGLNLNTDATRAVSNMALYAETTESHEVAVSGANTGLALVYADSNWRGPITKTFGQGSFTVGITDIGTNLMMTSISSYQASEQTLHDTVRIRFAKINLNSFTLFAWMTNFEGNSFWVTGDTVWGRMHSNGNLHIAGSPVFMGKTTTSKRFDPPRVGIGTNRAVFKTAPETGIAPITFPNTITDALTGANIGGHLYNSEIWVQFRDDGVAVIRTAAGGVPVDSIDMKSASFNGAIGSTQRVNVEGVVSGKVTITSGTDVRVTADVTYKDRKVDLLGLVAQNNVVIANTAANADGVNVDACIFANTGSFYAEGTVNGPFRLYGSIVQQTRGAPFGTSRAIRYDNRLSDNAFRPPFYPGWYRKTFRIDNWWENYRVLSMN